MRQRARLFRLFISSTFTDLAAERTALQEHVFPSLQALCRERDARFQAVDLRWGISAEAARDQKTVGICLQEIARCCAATPRPNFLVLLSERYGWRPPPSEIPADEFRAIVGYLGAERDAPGGGAWVSQWYERDENAVPIVYRLRRRTGDFAAVGRWAPTEAELVRALRDAAVELAARGVVSASRRLPYDASATEQEIAAGIPDAARPGRVLCVFRTVDGDPTPSVARQYLDVDQDARERLRALRTRLRSLVPSEDILEYVAAWTPKGVTGDHLSRFREDVYQHLSRVILEELDTPRGDDLDEERAEHAAFAAERSRMFVGRGEVLDRIEALVTSASRSPFAVIGPSGAGKSALVAKAVKAAAERHPDTIIMYRFVGATPGSSDPRLLLQGLCRGIARAYGASEEVPDAYEDLVRAFRDHLGHAWQGKPLIVFVDALDQLNGISPTERFPWLPPELPPYARVIVSALPELRSALERIVAEGCVLDLGALAPAEGRELLDCWLAAARRTLQPEQRRAVEASFARVPLPLFMRLVFEQVRHWRSDGEQLAIADDAAAVIQEVFRRLSSEENHGLVLVSTALSLLAAARYGLAEDELLDVLSADDELLADHRRRSPDSPPLDTLPPIVWSRLRQDLAPYLSERTADGAVLLSFFHRQMQEQVRASFLAGNAARRRHADLARYFRKRPLHVDSAKGLPDLRKISELPFQQVEAELWDDVAATLLDFAFLEAKTHAAGPQPLIDDFEHARSASHRAGITRDERDEQIARVGDAIRLSAHVLRRTPEQLPAHLAGRLAGSPAPLVDRLLADARAATSSTWLRPMTASLREPGDPLLRTLGGHAAIIFRVSVSSSGHYGVSAGNDRTATVWDLDASVEIHRLGHREAVFAAAITTDDRRVVCAAGPSLVLWDLARGVHLRTRDLGVGWIRGLAMTADGRAVFGSDEGVVGEWELETDRVISYAERIGPVTAVAVLNSGEVATSTTDRTVPGVPGWVVVWDLARRSIARRWEVEDSVSNLVATSDGRILLTASWDRAVGVWEAATGRLVRTLPHDGGAEGLAVDAKGRVAVSGGWDHSIKLWDLDSGNEIATLRGHHNMVRALAMAAGDRFVSGSDDQTVRVWDLHRARVRRRPPAHEGAVRAMALMPGGQLVATGCDDGALKLWSIKTGELVRCLASGGSGLGEIRSLVFTPDGRTVVSVSNGAVVHVRDAASGTVAHELHLVPRSLPIVETLVLAPDSKHFFYGSELFELATGKVVYVLPEWESAVMQYLSDGRTVVFVGNGRPMRLWDVEASREVGALPLGARAVALLPGDRLVSVSYDAVVRVWDLRRLTLSKELPGHRGRVDAVAVAVAAGETLAATASGDHDLRLWDLDAGREVALFSAEAPLWSCALATDGCHVVAGDELGSVHFLAVDRHVDRAA